MIAQAIPTTTALEAQAAANLFLLDYLGDRLLAVEPRWQPAAQNWQVKAVLTYPFVGSIGEVGEIHVSPASAAIVAHTALTEMKERARRLYEQHREAIEAAFLQAGNS